MNMIKQITALALLLGLTFTLACGGADTKSTPEAGDTMETGDMSGPEYTSAYVCPMHCEGSGSAEPGKCPVCKMDYIVRKDDHGHDHDHDHEGHSH